MKKIQRKKYDINILAIKLIAFPLLGINICINVSIGILRVYFSIKSSGDR